jgi:putative hydrolase of the HAD superfamily
MIPRKLVSRYLHPLAPIDTGTTPSGRLERPAAGVLFDIYGTLFVSGSGDIGAADRGTQRQDLLFDLLARYGRPGDPGQLFERLKKHVMEEHHQMKARGVDFPEIRIERTWRDLLGFADLGRARHFAVEYECIVNPVYPMPHLAELLALCRRRGIVMGIVSNAQFYTPYLFHWFLNASLGRLGIDPRLTFFSYRHGVAKPSRRLFEMAAARLQARGLSPGRVVYLGNDMRNDVLPAADTGFATALFAGD